MKREDYIENNCATSQFNKLRNYDTPVYKIWSSALNICLDGGLTSGLYVLAGAPSIGKTALTLQIADDIAKGNNEVLFISFDASRTELVAKSVSRTTAQMAHSNDMDISIAKTFKEISASSKEKYSSDIERTVLKDSLKAYMNYAHRTYIVEATGDFGVAQVREAVETHIASTGNTPVVFVDYLQALALSDSNTADNCNIDKVTLGLKQISRDFNTPVWTTSTISRESYDNHISLQSINSEAIEYLADAVIGMDFAKAETRDNHCTTIRLKVLKSKHAFFEYSYHVSFYPKFNLFTE